MAARAPGLSAKLYKKRKTIHKNEKPLQQTEYQVMVSQLTGVIVALDTCVYIIHLPTQKIQ